MSMNYSDPYKDDSYGKILGEKTNAYFKVTFNECKVYQDDDTYVLALDIVETFGVEKKFKKDELPIQGLATIPIHSKDYTVRYKSGNEWKNRTEKASVHEKLLYQHIEDNPSQWLDPQHNFKGHLSFFPDENYLGNANPQLMPTSVKIEQITPTGNLPDWKPKAKSSGSNWNNGSKAITIDDKVEFLKKELLQTILDETWKSAIGDTSKLSIGMLVQKLHQERTVEHKEESFLLVYLDLLKAIL
ncbi:MAG: hypothetical protein QNJ70_29795 [Xenococcaceae cyanobacterium MO_207.B15]|nr:hypothetical protein [Xenococcaceae cyanobacterium MO_207.B15]